MTTFTIPTGDIKAHVDRICAKHGLVLSTESLADSPSPYVARHVVRTPQSEVPVVAVAFREGDADEAIVEIWKVFVGWGIV